MLRGEKRIWHKLLRSLKQNLCSLCSTECISAQEATFTLATASFQCSSIPNIAVLNMVLGQHFHWLVSFGERTRGERIEGKVGIAGMVDFSLLTENPDNFFFKY